MKHSTAINSKTLVPGSSINFADQENIDYRGDSATKASWQKTQKVNPNDAAPDAPHLFGKIEIQLLTFAPAASNFQCGHIVKVQDLARQQVKGFECTRFESTDVVQEDKYGYRFCGLNVTCKAFKTFSGLNSVKFRFPDALQSIQWKILPDVWSDTSDENAGVGYVLSPNNIHDPEKLRTEKDALKLGADAKVPQSSEWKVNKQNQLTGSASNPTQITFRVTRSKYEEEFGPGKEFVNWGLQTSFSNEKKVEEQGSGTPLGSHVVEFQFDVQESVYISQWTVDNSFVSLFGTLISYLLSIIAVLKVAKLVLEAGIDKCLVVRAKKNKTPPPLDVLRREDILVEDKKEEMKSIRQSIFKSMEGVSFSEETTDTDSGAIELIVLSGEDGEKTTAEEHDEAKVQSAEEVSVEEKEDEHTSVATLTTTVAALSAELTEMKALMRTLLPPTVDGTEIPNLIPGPEEEEKRSIVITIPAGTHAGNTVNVNLPDGRELHITVPKGMKPGNTMTINYNQHGHIKENDD